MKPWIVPKLLSQQNTSPADVHNYVSHLSSLMMLAAGLYRESCLSSAVSSLLALPLAL